MAEVAEAEVKVSGRSPGDLTSYHLSKYYPPDYWDDAVCATIDMDMFFPERGSTGQPHINKVKAICMECPLRVQCLQFALDEDQVHGIWGGTTYRERLELKKLING